MNNIFIGIDPSINSTGICILKYEDDNLIDEHFYIVLPKSKYTKTKKKEQENYSYFDYIIYESKELKEFNEDNHKHEYYKTENMINLIEKIYELVEKVAFDNLTEIYVIMEGISYGSSIRTKSVFDLAGLNYMIRYILMTKKNIHFNIAPPSEIKKWVTGNGNCKKEIIEQLFRISHKNFQLKKLDDISDAYYMAKYAKKIYDDNI